MLPAFESSPMHPVLQTVHLRHLLSSLLCCCLDIFVFQQFKKHEHFQPFRHSQLQYDDISMFFKTGWTPPNEEVFEKKSGFLFSHDCSCTIVFCLFYQIRPLLTKLFFAINRNVKMHKPQNKQSMTNFIWVSMNKHWSLESSGRYSRLSRETKL